MERKVPDPFPQASGLSRRQSVIDALCEAFARDQLALPELERRLDLANRARTESELRGLLDGLDGGTRPERELHTLSLDAPSRPSSAPPGVAATISASRVPNREFSVAFWSGRSRKGSWIPARRISAIAVMGGIELDFREARFGPGVTELRAFAFMGGIEITVPPELQVETSGFAVMGGFDDDTQVNEALHAEGPILRVSGFALLGGVEVRVRLPGETEREARERKRREKRDEKEERRARKKLNEGR